MDIHRYQLPIRNGYQIWFSEGQISCAKLDKEELYDLLENADSFEIELDSSRTKKAISVIAVRKGFFRTKRTYVGHIDEDTAKEINAKGCLELLEFRPKALWLNKSKKVIFIGDLLGPSNEHENFF